LKTAAGGTGLHQEQRRWKQGNQVRLIIDTESDTGLIGGADFGSAITDRTIAMTNEIRPIIRKYGHTKALLALDAKECLEAEAAGAD
jgi:hypothetical protein